MKNTERNSESSVLRKKAEGLLKNKLPGTCANLSETDMLKLIHELHVHQLELEMQNDELLLAKSAAENAIELYDFAPSGYFTLSKDGRLIALNLTGAMMLGIERSLLLNKHFLLFVSDSTKSIFIQFLNKIFSGKVKEICEVTLSINGNAQLHVQLNGVISKNGENCLLTAVDINERKNLEEKLLKSETLLRETEKTGKIGGWHFNVETLIQTWTEETFRILEIDSTEGEPRVPEGIDFFAPSAKPFVEKAIHRAIEFGEPYDEEWEIITAKGNKRWVHAVARVHQEKGKTISLSGSFQDITERKQAEKELHETQAILKAAMDNSQAGIAIADAPNGTIRYVNNAGLLIRGGDQREVLEDIDINQYVNSWHLLDLDGRPLKNDEVPLARAIMFGETCSREFIVRRNPDDDRMVIANASPIKDDNGSVVAGIVVFMDITDRKKAEEALKLSNEKIRQSDDDLKKAQSVAHIGNWKWNINSGEIIWSDEMFRLFGIDKKTYTGRLSDIITKVIHPEDLHLVVPSNADSFALKKSIEYRIILPDNSIRHIAAQAGEIIADSEGKPEFLTGVAQDITDRKLAELVINNKNELLIKANADKDLFISLLAHDIKSPFSGLLGFLNMLSENIRQYDIDKLESQIKIINTTAQNIFNLLDDILIWGGLQLGKLSFKHQELNLAAICTNVIENLKLNAENKNIAINFDIGEDITVFADIEMLKTVLRNLLSNAIKFKNNSGQININVEKNDTFTKISVSDNGIGIAKDILANLFTVSKTYTTAGTNNERGTGLGLLLCKEFIDKQGGKIWAESEVDRGSCFSFTLPVNN